VDQSKDLNQENTSSEAQGLETGVEIPYASGQGKPLQRSWLRRYGFSMLVLGLCVVMGYYILMQQNQADELPREGQGAEFSYPDTDGKPVTLSSTDGKARLLYFFFASCPDVCPPTTALMSQVQDELKADGVFGDEVEFLSVTIDPKNDTTEVLKEYADRFGADPSGWKFLRGDEQATADLARKYSIDVGKGDDGNFYHMNLIVLLDKKGEIRDWISLNDYIAQGENNLTPSDMAKKIKSLL
jgi:protein SCO1/2